MKTMTRSNIYVAMAAMILTAAVAVAAAAQKQVPFKGAMQGHDTDTSTADPNIVVVTTSGTGIGTLLGQFSFTLENTVDLAAGTETGSAHFITANGDTLDATIVGSGELTPTPDVVSITEICTITGGTGRFAGVQGSFTETVYHDNAGTKEGTHGTCGSYSGTITPPGAAH